MRFLLLILLWPPWLALLAAVGGAAMIVVIGLRPEVPEAWRSGTALLVAAIITGLAGPGLLAWRRQLFGATGGWSLATGRGWLAYLGLSLAGGVLCLASVALLALAGSTRNNPTLALGAIAEGLVFLNVIFPRLPKRA